MDAYKELERLQEHMRQVEQRQAEQIRRMLQGGEAWGEVTDDKQ
jgi:hypothetical protein